MCDTSDLILHHTIQYAWLIPMIIIYDMETSFRQTITHGCTMEYLKVTLGSSAIIVLGFEAGVQGLNLDYCAQKIEATRPPSLIKLLDTCVNHTMITRTKVTTLALNAILNEVYLVFPLVSKVVSCSFGLTAGYYKPYNIITLPCRVAICIRFLGPVILQGQSYSVMHPMLIISVELQLRVDRLDMLLLIHLSILCQHHHDFVQIGVNDALHLREAS